jgi:Squalene-hopene cyclase C-terminal domain
MSNINFSSDTSESTVVGAAPPVPVATTPDPAPPPFPEKSSIKPLVPVAIIAPPTPVRVVPPPPPTRATLPPIRPAASPANGKTDAVVDLLAPVPVSGVGSAKLGRWSNEVPAFKPEAANASASSKDSAQQDEDDETLLDKLNHAAQIPSWLISTVLHLVLLLILALVSLPPGSGLSRMLLTIGQSERQSPVELAEFAITPTEQLTDADALEDVPMDLDIESLLTEVTMDVPIPMLEAGQSDVNEQMTEPVKVENGESATLNIVKPMFGGRSGAMRKALLAIYGGTQETEDAVELGLQWLKAQQQRNGSWSMRVPYSDGGASENNCAATAMALIAFMGSGSTHLSGPYAKEVERGIKWLVQQQDRTGFMAKSARDHERMYAQAQAMIAICELYGMTGDSWLRRPAELSIEFATESQSPEGGWRYEPGFDSDTSVTGWFLMGLKSGDSAGLAVDQKVYYNVTRFLDSVQSYDGAAYGYQQRRAASPAMTAEGLLCRQYLGWQRNVPAMQTGLETLVDSHMINMNDRDVYYWYYATQALHHFGGPLWKEWNAVMSYELPKIQVKNGAEKGSWSPQQDDWGGTAGRLYTTCLSIYCLEVYYRHMPLYSQGQ